MASSCIATADYVLYLASDALVSAWILGLNAQAENLLGYYAPAKPRAETYSEIVARTMALLEQGLDVCMAVYGHPGIGTDPTHVAIREARKRGHRAEMFPGVSALDCLSVDLGIDPVMEGCQIADATDFLIYNRKPDPTVGLILFQVGVTANLSGSLKANRKGLRALAEHLARTYSLDQELVLYEASILPMASARIKRTRLRHLPTSRVTSATTLYIAPAAKKRLNRRLASRLLLLPNSPKKRSN